MSNNKMKGLLKGLRYISQIFDNEKEPEMQIGYPTDVKHVAHIGWDGPTVNSPSWMNEFKSSENSFSSSSAPLNSRGEPQDENSIQWVSEDKSGGISSRSRGLDIGDMAELPRSARRQSSSGGDSPTNEKLDKPKHKRSSRSKDSTRQKDSTDSNPPTLPKSRRKKSVSKTSRSKLANSSDADCGSDSGSLSNCGSNFSALEDDTENGFS